MKIIINWPVNKTALKLVLNTIISQSKFLTISYNDLNSRSPDRVFDLDGVPLWDRQESFGYQDAFNTSSQSKVGFVSSNRLCLLDYSIVIDFNY